MLFNSYVFIMLFFPICMIGYFGLNHLGKYTLAQLFLFAMSLWFYGFFNPSYLLIILGSISGNFLITRWMGKTQSEKWKKAELVIALLLNLGMLFYYKYYDFFLENLNMIVGTDFALRHLLLPLGISFFTFQQISYVVDAYRGKTEQYTFLEYASFVAYFPQLIAGPIVTHDELIPQFRDPLKKRFQWDHFGQGLYMFAMGLAKKVLLADVFGVAANWGFADLTQLDAVNGILVSLAYTFQIYFDFSGYCDMAIGIGRMMNLDLPVNFDSPYKSLTIEEFWDRWHKTLGRFLTQYIYIPLGGNRKGQARTYVNILIVFIISGFWHGAQWAFVLWGILHGLFKIVNRHWSKFFAALHPAMNWLLTFSFVNFTWVLFRSESISQTLFFLRQMLKLECGPINENIVSAFQLPEIVFLGRHLPGIELLNTYPNLLLWVFYGGALALVLSAGNTYERMLCYKPSFRTMAVTVILLVWSILSLSGVSTFLYFNF